MDLRGAVGSFLADLFGQMKYHPLFSPYLGVLGDDPPEPYLHQFELLARLAPRRPIRVLIADEIGLGKTITAIAVAKYLERLGRVRRVLIVVPRVLVPQWEKELSRMGVPHSRLMRLDRSSIENYSGQSFPEGYYIASMDFLKREERISGIVGVDWDLVIVDEAHKFGKKTKRFWNIGKKLIEAKPSRNVVFLSATPHRGDTEDYLERLILLDPFLVKDFLRLDNRSFYEATHGSILFRRTKEDINRIYEEKPVFTDARFYASVIATTENEKKFVDGLVTFLSTKLREFAYGRGGSGGLISPKVVPLLTTLVFKRATSSPYAAFRTLQSILSKRANPDFPRELLLSVESFLGADYGDIVEEKEPDELFEDFLVRVSSLLNERDKEEMVRLKDMAQDIMRTGDSKLNATISLLEDIVAKTDYKVIVFTEYRDTLDYLYEKIMQTHPDWRVLRLSSKETQNEKCFTEVRRMFERDRYVRILLATDVVAEGVNLQVANILINYEVPWSLIKLEQRIGRVWRLGQKRDVEVYTLFMDNVADKAALNSLYQKLMNLKSAQLNPRPIVGQEVLLYAEAADLSKIPPPVALEYDKKTNKKKFVRVTEVKSVGAFLKGSAAGLEDLVRSILQAKSEIEREISSKGILYKPRSRKEVEEAVAATGFKDNHELFGALKSLLKASAPLLGLKVDDDGDVVRVQRGLEMPVPIHTLDGFYTYLASGDSGGGPFTIVARGEVDQSIILVPVLVRDRRDNTVVYADVVGVNPANNEVFRGASLLNLVSKAVANCVGVEKCEFAELPFEVKPLIVDRIKSEVGGLLSSLETYRSRLNGLREKEDKWISRGYLDVDFSQVSGSRSVLGCLHFVKVLSGPPTNLPEEIKKEVEEAAVQVVLKYERDEGRVPTRMAETEHFDIKSVDPSTGEVRIIEVKGHMGLEIYGELTEDEVNVALREADRYWLYIVYDIGSGRPKLLRFQDPLKTMVLETFERVEKRYVLKPRVETDGEGGGS